MNNQVSIKDAETRYPFAVIDGKINFELLALALMEDIADLQDQMMEKDYQILSITKRLDGLNA